MTFYEWQNEIKRTWWAINPRRDLPKMNYAQMWQNGTTPTAAVAAMRRVVLSQQVENESR